MSGTEAASASLSAALPSRPSPSRSHCSAAPATKIAPSSASPSTAAVRSSPCGGVDTSVAGVGEDEAARPVGASSPGRAGRSRARRARPAGRPRSRRPGSVAPSSVAFADDLARAAQLREHLPRHAEEREQLVVPVARREGEEQRPRRVRRVRDVGAGQLPDEPAVDRPEGEPVPGARRGRAATRASSRRSTGRARGLSARGSAPQGARRSGRRCVGPATRSPGARAARRAIPEHGRLALVRDADPAQVARREPAAARAAAAASSTERQISSGSCSTQPGCGKCCAELGVAAAAHGKVGLDDEAGRPGRPLVDREDRVAHRRSVRQRARLDRMADAAVAIAAERRARALGELGSREFDLLVIGGGIIGAGVAEAATAHGLAVAARRPGRLRRRDLQRFVEAHPRWPALPAWRRPGPRARGPPRSGASS